MGVAAHGAVTPIPGDFDTTASFLAANPVERLVTLDGSKIPERGEWLSPVTANQQFVCQGANYRQHMIESGMDPDAKKFNMIFTKATSCIVAADSPVVKPRHVRFLDYEIEPASSSNATSRLTSRSRTRTCTTMSPAP